jgi:hypothetical protein
MSHLEPGRRRESDAGLATLEPERGPAGERPVERERPAEAQERVHAHAPETAAEKSKQVQAGKDMTMDDLAERVERYDPRLRTAHVLVDWVAGVCVRRADPGQDGVHTIWMELCLLLILAAYGVA